MCLFSGSEPVHVSATSIFARLTSGGQQALVYAMHVNATGDAAMILPVPVRAGGRFAFVDLQAYPTFFGDLSRCWIPTAVLGGDDDLPAKSGGRALPVLQVGAFEASFARSRADLDRLDRRFRLTDSVWSALPPYPGWGFAVFQLRRGVVDVHPMAFKFDSREPTRLFFPTVHLHDGRIQRTARFDHALYAMTPKTRRLASVWQEADDLPHVNMDLARCAGLIADRLVSRHFLKGELPNVDTWAPLT